MFAEIKNILDNFIGGPSEQIANEAEKYKYNENTKWEVWKKRYMYVCVYVYIN